MLRRLLLILATTLFLTGAAAATTCPFLIGSTCFRVANTTEPLHLWEAEAVCTAWGGHLATVKDAAHKDALIALLSPPHNPMGLYTFGLYRTTVSESLTYMSGAPVTFTDLAADEPDSDDLFIVLDSTGATSFSMTGKSDNTPYPFICEAQHCGLNCSSCAPVASSNCTVCLPGRINPPACDVLDPAFCPALPSLDHGSVLCSNAQALGSTCTMACDPGYTLDGSRFRECKARPGWMGFAPFWSGYPNFCRSPVDVNTDVIVRSSRVFSPPGSGSVYAVAPRGTFGAVYAQCKAWGMNLLAVNSLDEARFVSQLSAQDSWVGALADPDFAATNIVQYHSPLYPYRWIANMSSTALFADDDSNVRPYAYFDAKTGEYYDYDIDDTDSVSVELTGICEGIACPGNCRACSGPPTAPVCDRCDDGYTNPPACDTLVADACPLLPPPQNGLIVAVDRRVAGTMTVSCNAGYKLMGSASRTCVNNAPMLLADTRAETEDTREHGDGTILDDYILALGVNISAVQVERVSPLARYDSVTIEFTIDSRPSPPSPTPVAIYMDASEGVTADLTSASHDLSSRPRSASFVAWDIPPGLAPGTKVLTPNLAPLIESVAYQRTYPSLTKEMVFLFVGPLANLPLNQWVEVDSNQVIRSTPTSLAWSGITPACVPLSPAADCPSNNRTGPWCISADYGQFTLPQAADACLHDAPLPSTLAAIDTIDKHKTARRIIDLALTPKNTWLGALRPYVHGRFRWTATGESFEDTFQFWRGSQPNEPIVQDGLELNTQPIYIPNEEYEWQDRQTYAFRHALCQAPLCLSPCATCRNDHLDCATCVPGTALPPSCSLLPPNGPSFIGLSASGKTSIDIEWKIPDALDPQEYDLRYRILVDGVLHRDASGAIIETYDRFYSVQGLPTGADVTVRVQALGAAGEGGLSPSLLATVLLQCPPGQFSENGGTVCTDCEPGSYSPDGNTCVVCPTLSTSPAASRNASQCECVAGFYNGRRTGSFADAPDCLACPPGALCDGGSAPPRAAPGYFPGAEATVFIECPNPAACTGSGTCAPGHTGRLCSSCSTGYYQLSGTCHECSPLGKVLVAVFVLAAFGVVAFLVWFNTQSRSLYKYAAMMIGLTSLQISAMYGELPLDWPSYAKTVFDVLSFANLNIELTSPECGLGASHVYRFKFVLTMLGPLLLLIPFGVIYVINEVYGAWVDRSGPRYEAGHTLSAGAGWAQRRWHRFRTQSMVRGQAMVAVMARAYFQLMTVLFLPLTSVAMSYYDCARDKDGRFSHVPYPADECFKGGHAGWLPFAVVFTAVYCVALPGGIVFLLFNRRRSLGPLEFALRYGFLVARFRESAFAFEVAIMARKLGVVLAMTSSYAVSNPHNKAFWGVVVLMLSTVHVAFVKPYHLAGHNAMAAFCVATSAVVLGYGSSVSLTSSARATGIVVALTLNLLVIVAGSIYDTYVWATMSEEVESQFSSTSTKGTVALNAAGGDIEMTHMGDVVVETMPGQALTLEPDTSSCSSLTLSSITGMDSANASLTFGSTNASAVASGPNNAGFISGPPPMPGSMPPPLPSPSPLSSQA